MSPGGFFPSLSLRFPDDPLPASVEECDGKTPKQLSGKAFSMASDLGGTFMIIAFDIKTPQVEAPIGGPLTK